MTKIKHFIKEPDELSVGRTIDAKEEELRRIFKKINKSTNTLPSQIAAKKNIFSVTNIHFRVGEATLNESAKRSLTEFCLNLQQEPYLKTVKLFVLGLAGNEATEKQQWLVSAKRAQAVSDFLGRGSRRRLGSP